MTLSILVDFGASRTKMVLFDSNKDVVIQAWECMSPEPVYGINGEVEVDPEKYWCLLEAGVDKLNSSVGFKVSTIWICSEMHGCLIHTSVGNCLVAKYISWRDERAVRNTFILPSTIKLLQNQSVKFFQYSGMNFKSGLPVLTLAHLNRLKSIPEDERIFTLVDWLLWRGGERDPYIHTSLAAGTGLFNIYTNQWSKVAFDIMGLDISKFKLPKVVCGPRQIGKICINGMKFRVFGGFGDLQAAAFGAGFPVLSNILINIGTGSQILINGDKDNIEKRPGINNEHLCAFTHIPSGRALNVFSNFFNECAAASDGKPFFWNIFSELSVLEVLQSMDSIDLNVFESSGRFKDGGMITKIREGSFTLRSFFSSLAKSWLTQYKFIIDSVDPEKEYPTFILSGQLSKRANFILPVLEDLCQRQGIICPSRTGEETLDGLLKLALLNQNNDTDNSKIIKNTSWSR